jgi:sugar lactone lactonase YvrE
VFGLRCDRVGGRTVVGACRQGRVGVVFVASLVVALGSASTALAGQPGTISDYAGTGTYGAPTVGPATSSALSEPTGVAVDSSGNVYIADIYNNEVEKVTAAGILSVIAGTGSQGVPTPGPAISSALDEPFGMAVNPAGDIYIADYGNSEIVKVTAAGTLSVIAGTGSPGAPTPGPATSSALNHPAGAALDPAGDLYIADAGNREVEKITPSGILSVIAGTGSTGAPTPGPATSSALGEPAGLALNSAGDLYIADYVNSEVEKITPSGILSVIAGTGSTGAPTPGPATSSAMDYPSGVAVDAAGDVYVADTGNGEIQKVTASGNLSVVAGTGSTGAPTYDGPATNSALNDPFGAAVDTAGDLYIADTYHSTIDLVNPAVPSNSAVPEITGTPAVGRTLSASTGAWSPTPSGYTREWQDCDNAGNNCTTISGATASTYTLTNPDVGHTIRVIVTASNPSGAATSTSAPSALVQAPPTTITTTTPPPTTTSPATTTSPTAAPVVTTGYPTPTGRLAGRALGRLRLGMTRAQSLRQYTHGSTHDKRFEEFFSLTGGEVRVGYPSLRLLKSLPSAQRDTLAGRVVLALTANPYYSLRGIRPGDSLRTIAKTLRTGAAIHVGRNDWYMTPDGASTAVLKVRHGTVEEIGIADATLTHTRQAQRTFITSIS